MALLSTTGIIILASLEITDTPKQIVTETKLINKFIIHFIDLPENIKYVLYYSSFK